MRRARQLCIVGARRKTVQEYLRSEPAYTLHRFERCRLRRNHTYVARIDA